MLNGTPRAVEACVAVPGAHEQRCSLQLALGHLAGEHAPASCIQTALLYDQPPYCTTDRPPPRLHRVPVMRCRPAHWLPIRV